MSGSSIRLVLELYDLPMLAELDIGEDSRSKRPIRHLTDDGVRDESADPMAIAASGSPPVSAP